ncbi:MAG: hypothetical protein D6719_05190 [Candidatus Dadabacteria bacterium]|nr:MAG: hypothetical protein D6719_05190 [Candidatus Dadabacteria bacterium]
MFMIFGFKRRKHPLPKFPPAIAPMFRQLCEALPEENIDEYKKEVEAALAAVREEAANNDRINLPLAEKLAERCMHLLSIYPELSEDKRALAIGAIRYFVVEEDPMSESKFAAGFDDDVKVMNHVLEELGLEDQYIELY